MVSGKIRILKLAKILSTIFILQMYIVACVLILTNLPQTNILGEILAISIPLIVSSCSIAYLATKLIFTIWRC
jgi:hypothetical protein